DISNAKKYSEKVEAILEQGKFSLFQEIERFKVAKDKIIVCDYVFEKEKKDWKMPEIKIKYQVMGNALPLWKFKNGHPFLLKAIQPKAPELYFFSCPLNSGLNSFLKHPSAVPLFLNMGFSSSGKQPLFYRPDKKYALKIFLKHPVNNIKISKKTEMNEEKKYYVTEVVTEPGITKIYPFYHISENGNYEALTEENEKIMEFSVNGYSAESEMRWLDEKELRTRFNFLPSEKIVWNDALLEADVNEEQLLASITDKPLWKYMLMCAIFCIFMEILLHLYYAYRT
ncbi:MAG: hypothetical protein N3F09_02640, partial [Bacteroidia bacterium]|nr:hypothetical protein [Bacteroidia bacterium]